MNVLDEALGARECLGLIETLGTFLRRKVRTKEKYLNRRVPKHSGAFITNLVTFWAGRLGFSVQQSVDDVE
jgi:hypothetical protein